MSIQSKIDYLLENYGIDDQRTQAWFSKRGEMLTASEIWKCFADATISSRNEIIMSKLMPAKKQDGQGVGALIWGTRFEAIAKEIYCFMENVKLVDLSCVRHPDHDFIGASPDGLILSSDERNGRLIELKCPISRIFDSNTPVPDHYYHQMQLQLECTGLQECDYVEMQFKTLNYSEWMESDAEFKSCFLVSDSGEVKYRPIHEKNDIHEWRMSVVENPMEWQTIFWKLAHWRSKLIQKDVDWMPQHFPEMKGTWDEILKHRAEGTFPDVQKGKGILVL